MRKFLVTIILLVTMVLSNRAASSYNAMLPSTGRDFWLTFMYNYAQPATSVELQLYAVAEAATTITVTAADGTVLVAGQPIAAGAEFIYTIPSDQASKVYNTGTDITELKGLHVTSTADIALYMRNGYSDGDLSYDMSPVFSTSTLGKEYMVQTWTRDMDRTEMAIVATEDGTQVTIVTGNEAQKNNGTTYSAGQTINLAMNAGQVYQLKGTTYNKNTGTGSLTGTTIQANKKVAVFNGGSKATIPHNTGANGDHLCEQSIPVEAWGKRFVLQEMNGFPGLEEEDVSSMPTEYYITAVYDNTEVKVNGATKTTLQKGESYKVTVKYTEFPKLAETSMPVICYGYMTNGATNNYNEETYGEPSMVLIPATEKGVNKVTLYAPKFNDPAATDIKHFANVTIASTGTSTMMLNGANVGSQFTTISGGLAYARLELTEGINILSNTECRFVAVAYDIEPDLAISQAYATTINMTSAAPKVYIDNELVDDSTVLEWCNNHPGINFRAEIDYPHDSVRWTFGDGNSSTSIEEQHEYHLKVEGQKETNNVCLYVYHHTPLANEKKIDSVHVSLIVHPTYYFPEEVYTVCGKDNSFYWEHGDTTFTFNKSTNQTITYKKNFGTVNYGCDSIYSLKLIVKPEVFGDTVAYVCPSPSALPYHWHGKTISTDGGTLVDTLTNQFGCDSIVTLTLHVRQPTSSQFSDTACVSYMWGTHKFTESCDYDSIFTNQFGCDSTVTLHLVIYNNETSDTTAVECDSFTWHDNKYTTSGNYIWHGNTIHGCDSAVTLHLTINHSQFNRDQEETICSGESFVWHEHDYKNELTIGSQWLKWEGTTTEGCTRRDSIQVNVKPIQRDTTKDAICEGEQYTWRGNTYEKAITTSDTVSCSEIYTLQLTVNPKPTITNVVLSDDSICYGIDKTINVTYSASSNAQTYEYTVYSQDSIPEMSLPPHPGLSPARASIITSVTGSGSVGSTPITVDVQSLPAGEYQFQFVVKSDYGCVSDTAYVSMTICKQPTITMTNPSPICGNLENIDIPYTTTDAQSITYTFSRISDSQVIVPTKTVTATAVGNINLTMPTEGLTPGDYRLTVSTESLYGCRGEEEQMTIQVKEITIHEETDSICGGETYNWHGYTLTESCDTTYQPSCDVLYKLSLTVLEVTNMPVKKDSICAGNTYTWRDHNYTTADTYTDTVYHEGTTCPKEVYTLDLTVLKPVTAEPVNVTICPKGEYRWDVNNTIYTKAGTYEYTSKYANGCDSAYHTLTVAVRGTTSKTDERTICEAELPYTWSVWPGHNLIFKEFGTKEDTARYQSGCDSVYYTLTLKGQKVDTTIITGITCLGSTYTWEGGTIDADAVGTTSYYYTVPFATAACPSKVLQLDLTVQAPQEPKIAKISACESYTWNKTTYTTSGKYEYTYKVGSCEITDTLYLTIGQPWIEKKDTTIRPQTAPFTWQGATFTGVDVPGKQTKTLKLGTGKTACGCDSIREVTVIVTKKIIKETTDTVCYGTPYNWRGEDRTETDTYIDDTNIDTTFILHLNALKTKELTEDVKLCGESSYKWLVNGQTYTTSGEYEYITKYRHFDCDSIHHVLKLTLGQPNTGTENISVCAGENVIWNGGSRIAEFGSDFAYTKTLTNKAGCDSVVTVNVHVKRSEHITLPADTICESELPYVWEGQKFTTGGNHTITYTNKEGCDSVVTLPLTIYPTYNNTINKELNEGETYQWSRGENGSRDTLVNTTGDWYDYQTTIYGCDSTTHLHVQYVEAERETVDRTACDSFEWGGQTYTKSGVYGDTTWSADHKYYTKIRFVNLTINESKTSDTTAVECGSFTWHNTEYTTSGDYIWTGATTLGCDSVVTLHLTIKSVEQKPVDSIEVCETELPYIWHDQNYNTAGTYGDTLRYPNGCDSIIYTLKLTVKTVTPDQEFNETTCQQSTFNWTAANMSINCRNLIPGKYTYLKDTIYPGECDVCHLTLNLTVTSNDPVVTYDTICYGDSYDWYVEGQLRMANLTSTCTQNDTIHDEDCDRIYRLELEVREPVEPQVDDTVYLCALDEPVQWHGMTLSESGTYTFREEKTAQDGHCNNIYQITIVRTILEQKDYTDHACLGDDYIWNDHTITADELSLGVNHFYDTVPAVAPATCPTIVNHLALNVTRPYTYVENVIACEEYTWRGHHYTESTTDTYFVPATENSCDSTFVLNLTIGHSFEQWDATTITEDMLPYTWHHSTFTNAGSIDETYRTAAGCDSIWHLTLTVSERIPDTTNITICEGDTYKWSYDNIVYSESGIYSCTTIDKQPHLLYLTVNPTYTKDVYAEECVASYTWHGTTYTASGDYTWTGATAAGCDSIETLHLTLLDNTAHDSTCTVCPGELVRWGNTNYTAVAGETKVLTRTNQCGIDETLTVTVRAAVTGDTTATACESFEWHGETYTTSGNYTWTGTTANGCDSVATLHLTISEPFYNEEDVQVHETALPYRWTGHKGDTAIYDNGDYYDLFTTETGCDSIYHLHLHIGFITRDTVAIAECDSYEWNGTTYTESKLYTDTVWNEPTHETYDAIHYLDLTIHRSVHVEEDARQYCEGESFEWKGQTYTLPVGDSILVHEAVTPEGCDSITTMHVTILPKYGHSEDATICWSELPYIWRGKTLNAGGTYNDIVQAMSGCDSILTINLTVIEPAAPGVEEQQEICLSNTYEWNGMSIHKTEVGEYTYYYHRFDENECDTITDVLTLTVKENDKDTIHDISCFGATYEWIVEDNITLFYGTPKTDVWHVDTVHHELCDHIYVLDLKVMPEAVTETTDTTICEGSDFLWTVNGQSYSKSGQYTDILSSQISDCDSIIRVLNLKVRDVKRTNVELELCEGSNYTFFGEEFTNLQVGTIEREHVEKYTDCDCDSAVTTLTLTVVPTLIDETSQIEACGEYTWNDVTPARTYNNISSVPNAETLYFNDTVITQEPGEQCATKHILHLTLKPSYELTVDTIVRSLPVIYKGILFNSSEATVTIDTTVTMKASTTCDSIYHITVVKTDKEVKNETATICEGDTLNWRGGTYTTAGSYTNTTAHPDTVFNLELIINPMTRHEAETIVTCDDTYTWHGHTLTESTTCYDTVAGQGDACAEIYTLYLTMVTAEPTVEYDTICADMLPYTWAGRGTYSIAGTDTTLLSEYTLLCGETITDIMHVHVWPIAKSEEEMTTCSNEPVIWNGSQYNTTGDYTWTGSTIHGCDSTATLHLTVLDAFIHDEYVEVAEGPYEWRGRLLTEDGVYADSLKKENGCDSIYSIRFHINIAERISEDQAECGSYTWSQTGETYTESGAKTDTVWNAEHTNYTIYTLNLTIWPQYDYVAETDTVSILSGESYEWYDSSYTISGDYTHMVTTEHGCDSLLASLHLIVGDPIINDEYVEACENEGYEFKGKTYTETTILYDSLKTAEGLDSINVIHLTIWPTVTHTLDTTVCEVFEWNGLTLTESCTQEIRFTSAVTGCDSIDRLVLTITDSIILVPGNELIVDKLGYCPGDTAYIPYNLLKGHPTAYKLDFNPAAVAQGFVGHDYEPLNGHQDIVIAIPEDCDAGTYDAILQLTDYVSESKKHTFRFTVAVDGVLHTMWNDVLAIDNSKGLFFGYRWYRDGELVQDAGKQYYNQNGEPLKGEYRAGLMLENGMWIYTCPLEVDMTNEPLSLTAMPCPAPKGMPVTLTIHGADLEMLADGTLTVYSTSGQIVYHRDGAEHQQQVDLTAGQYIGVFRTDDNRSVNVKFLVY